MSHSFCFTLYAFLFCLLKNCLLCKNKLIWNSCHQWLILIFITVLVGVGFASMMVSFLVCVYYNIIIAWCLYYLFLSMAKDVPWKSCGNWWNTAKCLSGPIPAKANCAVPSNSTAAFANGTSVLANSTALFANGTGNATLPNCTSVVADYTSPPLEYWE